MACEFCQRPSVKVRLGPRLACSQRKERRLAPCKRVTRRPAVRFPAPTQACSRNGMCGTGVACESWRQGSGSRAQRRRARCERACATPLTTCALLSSPSLTRCRQVGTPPAWALSRPAARIGGASLGARVPRPDWSLRPRPHLLCPRLLAVHSVPRLAPPVQQHEHHLRHPGEPRAGGCTAC
jgi:hypothetical protein